MILTAKQSRVITAPSLGNMLPASMDSCGPTGIVTGAKAEVRNYGDWVRLQAINTSRMKIVSHVATGLAIAEYSISY